MNISGRKYVVIACVSTYCLAIIGALALVILGKMQVETFIGMFAGLGSIVLYVAKAYFDDKDRSLNQTKGGSNG